MIAKTPAPPYFAVIFSSIKSDNLHNYSVVAKQMLELASQQEGFLGVESASTNNFGITVSFWRDIDSIKKWKENSEHKIAQEQGKTQWYKNYKIRICKVERDYEL